MARIYSASGDEVRAPRRPVCIVALVACAGLEVEAQQRLGVGRPQVEPPVAEVDGEPVEAILRSASAVGARPPAR